jgi:hypothetical protein
MKNNTPQINHESSLLCLIISSRIRGSGKDEQEINKKFRPNNLQQTPKCSCEKRISASRVSAPNSANCQTTNIREILYLRPLLKLAIGLYN